MAGNASKMAIVWAAVRDSLWFIPAVITALGAALAFASIWIDRRFAPGADAQGLWYVFGAGADGARGVLSAIASSIITVTGVVFSVTIVALQLASSQFTPRVLRSFTEDRANQIVLGVFIATFTYSLLVLRTVRSPGGGYGAFVPSLSVTLAVVLALVSIGFLIFFINHIASSIRAETIIQRVTGDALEVVEALFPDRMANTDRPGSQEVDVASPDQPAAFIAGTEGGYLQLINEDAIVKLADDRDLLVKIDKEIGDFVLSRETLASVWPIERVDEATANQIRAAFVIGAERTRLQDVERGIIELTDIGVRALSPGINDPTTAIVCVDRLSQILAELGAREFPPAVRTGGDGKPRVLVRRTAFDRIHRLAYAQLRHHGVRHPAFAIRLLGSLGRLGANLPLHRRDTVIDECEEVIDGARREIRSARDLERVEQAAQRALAQIAAQQRQKGAVQA